MARIAVRSQISALLPGPDAWRIETVQIDRGRWEARVILAAEGSRGALAEQNLRDRLRELTGAKSRARGKSPQP